MEIFGGTSTLPFTGVFLFSLLLLSPSTFAQVIKIRVMGYPNGQPLPKQQVLLAFSYDKDEKPPANGDAKLHLETDTNGEIQFKLPERVPGHIWAQVKLTSGYWHCGCVTFVDTRDLVQKGFVVTDSGQATPQSGVPVAEPGKITFLARPFTFLEKLLRPLLKG